MTQPLESNDKESVQIGFCLNNSDRGYRGNISDVCGSETLSGILKSKEVQTTIGDIQASVYRSGCLSHCSSCRAAKVTVGNRLPETVSYQSAEDLKKKLSAICARNPEKWARIEILQKEYFACVEAYREAYMAKPQDKTKTEDLHLRLKEASSALRKELLPETVETE